MKGLAERQGREDLLGLFGREPVAGRCKTRLAAVIGDEGAARLADAFLRDTVTRFGRLATTCCLAYAPDSVAAHDFFQSIGEGHYEIWPQPEGDLGVKLGAFLDEGLARFDRVVVIGTDSPSLPVEFVERAFAVLHERDCVLGPATDGGFYLIGLRRWGRDCWGGWGGAHRACCRRWLSALSRAPSRWGCCRRGMMWTLGTICVCCADTSQRCGWRGTGTRCRIPFRP